MFEPFAVTCELHELEVVSVESAFPMGSYWSSSTRDSTAEYASSRMARWVTILLPLLQLDNQYGGKLATLRNFAVAAVVEILPAYIAYGNSPA
jgi:hypothetical protein